SEEHTSEPQSLTNLVCRLLLEKKKNIAGHEVSFSEPPACSDADGERMRNHPSAECLDEHVATCLHQHVAVPRHSVLLARPRRHQRPASTHRLRSVHSPRPVSARSTPVFSLPRRSTLPALNPCRP